MKAVKRACCLVLAAVAIAGGNAQAIDEVNAIRTFVYDQFILSQAHEPKIRPTMYFRRGGSTIGLTIYGVLRSEDQDRIVEFAREARKRYSSRPVVVVFMEAEVWKGDGNSKWRSGEKLLRRVKVDD